MKYKKLVSVDNTGLKPWAKDEISSLAEEVIFYDNDPTTVEEIIERVKDADCILVSWRTQITKEIIDSCENLKYVGMCCSLYDENSANVNIKHARENGIKVLGIRDYGDEGLVEFALSELIRLFHGFGEHQWSEKQEELTGKNLGIIGMGVTGQMLADRASAFGMNIYYYSRTRKEHLEANATYLPLNELLEKCDVISTHLPKHTKVLFEDEFNQLGNHKVFINTSLELTGDLEAFKTWLSTENNYAIFDISAFGSHFEELSQFERMIHTKKQTGFTNQAEDRLSQKVIDNIISSKH